MQEAQCNKQSTLKDRLYYVGSNYIVQDIGDFPFLVRRNGRGSDSEVETILKMCGMKIQKKESDIKYRLEVVCNG